mgnify:CR=1 FL=1
MNTLKQLPELTALVEAGKNPFNQVLMDYVDKVERPSDSCIRIRLKKSSRRLAQLPYTFAVQLPKARKCRSILPTADLQLHETHL